MFSRPTTAPHALRFGARRRAGVSAVAGLVLLALPLVGCGKKGDPMPAPRTIPAAATDLKVRQRGLEVVAEFGYPKATVAGLPLQGLDQVTLYVLERPVSATVAATPVAPTPQAAPAPSTGAAPTAAVSPPATPATALVMPDPREFVVAAKPFLALSGAELASAISGDRITLRFRLLEPLAVDLPARIFSVRTHAAGGELSDWSNLAGLLPRAPASPPANFLAVSAKNGVLLSWNPATTPGIAGYNLYRRDAARTSYGEPVATLDATAATAIDEGVTYGRRYIYALTAIGTRQPLAESALSSELEIDYQDRFAPAPPAELSALGSVGEVRLVWPASSEADVAGYVVERADPDADFHRVNVEPVAALEFTDRGLASGFTFRFRVAAIDKSGNLGPPGEPVSTRVP
ncbi:MAG: fibronectin type III domain-containing protein [Thermoanaerobaculia bacterium]